MKRYFEKIRIASKMRNAVKVGIFLLRTQTVIIFDLSTESCFLI